MSYVDEINYLLSLNLNGFLLFKTMKVTQSLYLTLIDMIFCTSMIRL